MTALQPTRTMSGQTWGAIATGFVGAFLIGLAVATNNSNIEVIGWFTGAIFLLVALGLAVSAIRNLRAESAERNDWARFAAALDDGVHFEVPEEMGYAAELPAVLDDLADVGQPSDGEARHAIVGEEDQIHWCAFQHERPMGTATVGMIGLHPDRKADAYPQLEIRVNDPDAADFDRRFEVLAQDRAFADLVLHEQAREHLMATGPFDWRLEGNQIITTLAESSTPEQAITFIEDRVKPLARVAGDIPLDA
ncbi:MAG: hypothetical protein ACK5MR_08265 [Cumulibacter sp.]